MHEPFSLLLSVYDGDRPDFLRRAYLSAIDEQTVRPAEAIIVQDGPVRPELAECLDELRASSPVPVTFLPLPANGGLGPALDKGLAAASYDVIARMDADDIAMPNRFEIQLPLIAQADIVGGGLIEFVGEPENAVGRRVPPSPSIARSLSPVSAGMISAASASPSRTFWIACARVETRIGSTSLNNREA